MPFGSDRSRNKGRNRDERRIVSIFEPVSALLDTDWRPQFATIIRVEREVFTRNSSTGKWHHSAETAFYVANTKITATRAAEAIRAHWGIETTSHYSRDVTMGEDRSRIRSNPGVFARMRSFAFNILMANRSETLPQDRYRAALGGLQPLLKLLVIQKR